MKDAAGGRREVSAVGNPYGFTGRRFDAETGLYYYKSRFYDPSIGRFLSRDIYPGNLREPGELVNKYAYVTNNPVKYVDPFGFIGDIRPFEEIQHPPQVNPNGPHRNRNKNNRVPYYEPKGGTDSRGNRWIYDPSATRVHGGNPTYRGTGEYWGSQATYRNGKILNSGPYQGTYDYSPPFDRNGNFDPWGFYWHWPKDIFPHYGDDNYYPTPWKNIYGKPDNFKSSGEK